MNEIFSLAVSLVLALEGGYSNNKNDRGGATKYGITSSDFRIWRTSNHQKIEPVSVLTKDEAIQIYEKTYWLKHKYNQIAEVNPKIAIFMFQFGVNCGDGTAIKILQRLIGVNDDGIIGPQTLKAISNSNEQELIIKLSESQLERYKELVDNDDSQNDFMHGWISRINKSLIYLKQNSTSV